MGSQERMHATKRMINALKANVYPENLTEIHDLVRQWIEFDALFSQKLKILRQRDCLESTLEALERPRNAVIATAIERGLSPHQRLGQRPFMPFAPVIPFFQLSIPTQMDMVHFWRIGMDYLHPNRGKTFLEPDGFKDVGYFSTVPHWIFNIQLPERPMEGGVAAIEKAFSAQGRRGLYLAELLSVCIQDGVSAVSPLREPRHAIRSQYVSVPGRPFEVFVPGVQIDSWDRPLLREYPDRLPLRAPSCDL